MRQGVGLARSGTRDDEERRPRRAVLLPNAMLDGPPLFGVEGLKVGGYRQWLEIAPSGRENHHHAVWQVLRVSILGVHTWTSWTPSTAVRGALEAQLADTARLDERASMKCREHPLPSCDHSRVSIGQMASMSLPSSKDRRITSHK